MTGTLLAISGSLRTKSSNTAVLLAAAGLAPEGVEVKLFKGLEDLPFFNPDKESTDHPAVLHFRREIKEARALLICSPEYAHGIPGVLKNALDWIVGTAELDKKKIGVINVTPLPATGTAYALENLVEILRTMSADVKDEYVLKIGEIKSKFQDEVLTDEKTKAQLKSLLEKLLDKLNSVQNET